MESNDFTLTTTGSMAIVLDENGCCVRHPSVKLKDYNKNGDVYLKESCPECQCDFAKSQSLLLEKRRELDRKLQELGDDSPHDDRHAQMVAPNVGGLDPGSHTPHLPPRLPTARPVPHDLGALVAQVHHIQRMQDILMLQKDRQLHELCGKLEALQIKLADQKIENALLHERMSQQQLSYERELKLIQRAVALEKEMREARETSQGNNAKEIHIRSLNVQVGNDYAESSVTKKMAAATLMETLEEQGNKVFITDKTSVDEESSEGPKSSNSPVESNMTYPVEVAVLTGMATPSLVLAETSNDTSKMATIPTVYAVEETSDSEEGPSHVSPLKNDGSVTEEPIDEEYVIVEPTQEQWTSKDPSFRSYDSSVVVLTYLNSTADESPCTEYPFHRPLPEPNIKSDDDDEDEEEEKGEEKKGEKEEEKEKYKFDDQVILPSLGPSDHSNLCEVEEDCILAETTAPTVALSTYVGFVVSNQSLLEPYEEKGLKKEKYKFDEQVTLLSLGPSDHSNLCVVEDEDYSVAETTAPTVASSTYGENRRVVSNQTLLDPYGEQGVYSGVLLLSTNLPHGNGKMLYEDDGRTYDGDWRHGRWHGWGKATFSNGDRFEGFYKYDQRHGQGKYEWSDGRVYEGEFSDDKRCGKGHFIWPDGADYVGDFENGLRHGRGVFKFAHNAGQYDGDWVNGQYEGYGDCMWSDGRMYKGEWKAGLSHGRGTEWYPDGRIRHEGHWFEDEPVYDENEI